jgi:hypothetical protein
MRSRAREFLRDNPGTRRRIGLKRGVGVTAYGRVGARINDFRSYPAQEFLLSCRSRDRGFGPLLTKFVIEALLLPAKQRLPFAI